jgi:hypothetical protein
MIDPEGIGPVVCPLASINIPRSGSTPVNATRSGINEARVGVGEGAVPTEPLVDAGDPVGEDVGEAPQAARAVALTITSAARWIRIEWFLSSFGVCMWNDHLFVSVTRLKRSRARQSAGTSRPLVMVSVILQV